MTSPFILMFLTASAILTLLSQRKHLLSSLLSLEAMMLSLACFLMFSWGATTQMDPFLFIVILTFGACEASLGLALLVAMTRSLGSDMTNLLTSTKC